jgi:hypothetical protein
MVHQKSWLYTWIEVLISHHVTILQVSFRVKYPPEFESWRKDELGDFKSTRYGKVRPFFISALLLFLLLSLFLLLFVFVVIGLLCRKNLCGPYKLL